jgi:hypothetical protein
MTVRDDVADLVRQMAPHSICDDCIADKLRLSVRQHANHKSRELARSREFHREKDLCGSCGLLKLVIRYGPRHPF